VLVVGGGHAAATIAHPLSSKLDAAKYKLILINPRPFRILFPTTLRMVVSEADNLGSTAQARPFRQNLSWENGTFLQNSIYIIHQSVGESSGFLTLGSGERVAYDIL
ncbi:hypothetical protein B0H13DRAFT_1521098, partial [Mycena leptocephala]